MSFFGFRLKADSFFFGGYKQLDVAFDINFTRVEYGSVNIGFFPHDFDPADIPQSGHVTHIVGHYKEA